MTVPSQDSQIIHACDGVSTVFAVPFYFLRNQDLVVTLSGEPVAEQTLALGTDYSVSGTGNEAGGSITTTAVYPLGQTLAIERVVPVTQETSYQPNDPFPAKSHERALDKLTMICQQFLRLFGSGNPLLSRVLMLGRTDINGHGSYRANNNRIQDLADPAVDKDAVNRRSMFAFVTDYVDKAIAGVVGGFGWFLQAGIGAIFRTFQDKMRDFVNVKDFGAALDGVTDDTQALSKALATGKKVRFAGRLNVTDTPSFAVDGQVLCGDGKDGQSVIVNTTNDKPLFAFSKGTGEVYRRRCGIEGVSFEGNELTTEGVALRGPLDDGLVGDADKSCWMREVRISGVGAGHGLRVSSWSNVFNAVEIWECYAGLKCGSEFNANAFHGLYINRCTKEAIVSPDAPGVPASNTFINTVAQYCGGDNATIDLQEAYSFNFFGLYLEGNTAPANVLLSGKAHGCTLTGVMHNLVTGTPGIQVIRTEGKSNTIRGAINLGGTIDSLVRVEGALPTTVVSGLHMSAGTATNGELYDISTRKATVRLDGLGERLGPTVFRTLIGENPIELRRSDTDAVVGFWDGTGKMFFGPDATVPALSRSGGTLSMTYGAGTGTFRAPQLGLGATGGPIWLSGATSPEGANTASPGSLYSRTSGGANTTLYVKEIGTGNTGWVAK
jgi:hypothetical protein